MTNLRIDSLYESYLVEALRVEKARKPGEGIFGIGKKPSDNPCHDRFVSDLGVLLEEIRSSAPSSSEVRDILDLIYREPKKHPEPLSSFWVLIAVQKLTLELIPLLQPSDAAALASDYASLYKRRERLPVQNQVLKELNRAAQA